MTPRLLGLAFAAADLLIELDGEQRVGFCVGAGPGRGVDPSAAWRGKRLIEVLDAASRRRLAQALADLGPGARSPAVEIVTPLADGMARRGRLSLFRMPDLAPRVSCAVSWDGEAVAAAPDAATPTLDAEGLLSRTRSLLGGNGGNGLALDFVDVAGLGGTGEAQMRAAASIEALLQLASIDGSSAARLTEERYALVRAAGDDRDLAPEVRDAGRVEGLDLTVETGRSTADVAVAAGVTIRAMRLALENCLKAGAVAAGVSFAQSLSETVRDAERFRAVVRGRDFALHYQPIVALASGDTHHFEALARFAAGGGPSETIHMAEELGLIEGFDFVVVEKALAQLRRPGFGRIRVAVNVSGASLSAPAYVEHVLHLTATTPDIRKRLMIEVTETAALADLEGADRRLRALREAGVQVCLDDFGAGAASFDYLSRLSLDVVKIDGHFMRDIAESARSRTLIGHLVTLCGDLKLATVAEMVETEAQAQAVRRLGVGFGQGWHFGRPAAEPALTAPAASTIRARRMGAVEAWG